MNRIFSKPLLTFSAAVLACAAVAFAQEPVPASGNTSENASTPRSSRTKTTAAAATPKPTAEDASTPAAKKKTMLQRVFGGREKATPKPVATPAPTPRVYKRRPKATPAPDADPKPAKSTNTKSAKVKSEESEDAKVPPSSPAPTKKGTKSKPAPTKAETASIEPPADADPEVKEKFRYESARAKALEDPLVKELKDKADGAATEEESRTAARAFNKALFGNMKKIDSSISERADRMEAAMMKRLDEQ